VVGVLQGGPQDVYWRGTDGNLWFAEWADGAWLGNVANMTGDGPVDSQPVVTSSAVGLDVFWIGPSGHIWMISQSASMQASWNGETAIVQEATRA
jgi:hypothetical protein